MLSESDLVDRSVTKTEAAYKSMRRWIETGRLQPGARLTVAEAAAALRMSPTPVREAMRLLQSENLLQARPHQGSVVTGFSVERIADIYRIRLVLEPIAAGDAAERAGDDEIREISRIHSEFMRAVGKDAHRAIELNGAWHLRIAQASGSTLLQDFISRLWTLHVTQGLWATGHMQSSARQHEAVTRAIVARDAAAASEAMTRHCESGAAFYEGLRNARDASL